MAAHNAVMRRLAITITHREGLVLVETDWVRLPSP